MLGVCGNCHGAVQGSAWRVKSIGYNMEPGPTIDVARKTSQQQSSTFCLSILSGHSVPSTVIFYPTLVATCPRSSFVALFSGRLACWLLFGISVRKSISWPKRLLLQFTYASLPWFHFMLHYHVTHSTSSNPVSKTKWCNDKWPANRQG